MKKPLLLILCFGITTLCFAQDKFWKFESEQTVSQLKRATPQLVAPTIYRTLSLPFDQYKAFLNTAPSESFSTVKNGLIISLPYPDNSFKRFRIVETSIMESALARQFPQIKTYAGQGIDDSSASVRIDYTTQGFHAYVISAAGSLFIDPYQKANNDLYITYFSKDYVNLAKEKRKCINQFNRDAAASSADAPLAGSCIGTQLRTYRAAISCTGEYAVAVCPAGNVTKANTLSAIITTMNRVNGVYQTELDVKMVLVGTETAVIYTDPDNQPYTGNDDANTLIDESQQVIDSVIGNGNYDIGHTFSTGEGGLSALGVVCLSGEKASSVTGLPEPTGDKYDIDFVSHEMGHEFGASHTFESQTFSCGGGNRSQSSAYEVGSGTTIMAYAGICTTDDIQEHSDPYFHTKSFDQIVAYTTTGSGGACPVITSTGNHAPVVVMPVSGIRIPKGTPFTLSGTASDIDGDALTYSWEEWDLSNSSSGSAWNGGANSAIKPLFKARIPKTSGSRTFPDMAVILANYPANPLDSMGGLKGETLPQVARDIKFRLVARDNNAGGGGIATGGNGCSSSAAFKVTVTADGPFKVTSPNTAVNWLGESVQTVTWNVANTDSVNGINVQNVDILMSTDGGYTYPTTILLNTPNDGTQNITVPNIPTNSTVRFMIKATGNIFFDISDVNFTITFNSVLPISLLQFSANAVENAVLLTWSTTTELNNKGFEVMRSDGSGNDFVEIGFVAGAGNSGSLQKYSLTDKNVKKGVVYFYRLRQVDVNNNGVYSDIKRAKIDVTGIFSASLQPQPFYNNADLYLDGIGKSDFIIVVTDVVGRVVIKHYLKNNEESRLIPIDFTSQSSGIYFIKILQDNSETTLKAIKL